jgi:hypothetical protein
MNAGGEELFLFKSEDDGIRVADGITVPALPTDFSYGRENDAQDPWILFSESTPGSSNSSLLGALDAKQGGATVYPNPVSTLLFFGARETYQIHSIDGRNLAQGTGDYFDASALTQGVYVVRFNDSVQRFVKQ